MHAFLLIKTTWAPRCAITVHIGVVMCANARSLGESRTNMYLKWPSMLDWAPFAVPEEWPPSLAIVFYLWQFRLPLESQFHRHLQLFENRTTIYLRQHTRCWVRGALTVWRAACLSPPGRRRPHFLAIPRWRLLNGCTEILGLWGLELLGPSPGCPVLRWSQFYG